MNKAPCCASTHIPLPRPVPCASCGTIPCTCCPPAPPKPCVLDPCACTCCPRCGASPCVCPCPPRRPMPCYFVQKVVGCGAINERCALNRLCPPLPDNACPPLTLVNVCVCNAVKTTLTNAPCQDALVCVSIPLTLTVRDQKGCCYQVSCDLERTVPLRLHHHAAYSPLSTFANARVRLVCNAPQCADGCFNAQLEVHVEVYATALCPMGMMHKEPDCFDPRPLYPPPIYR